MRARLLVPLALLAVAALPTAARAAVVGISDPDPASFADARLRALHLGSARLVVPYDTATSEPPRVQAWLAAVAAAGLLAADGVAARARRRLLRAAAPRVPRMHGRRGRRARLRRVHPLDRAVPRRHDGLPSVDAAGAAARTLTRPLARPAS